MTDNKFYIPEGFKEEKPNDDFYIPEGFVEETNSVQPQVVQDSPMPNQAVQNNDGSYTLSTGIQKRTPVGRIKNIANKAFNSAFPLVGAIRNAGAIANGVKTAYNNIIKPTYEKTTQGLWHLGGKGLRAILPKKAALPFLSEDWWFGTDEQHERLNQLDNIAKQTGYYDQNAVRNDFMQGKLSRKQANAYAQLVGERERLLSDLNYTNARAGNTAEGIVDVGVAAVPGGEFKGAGSIIGKGIYNATRGLNASKKLSLGTGKVGRYLTKHTLRGGQIGAEMAAIKNLYENGAGIEHEPFAKELAENIGIGILADNILPVGIKGAGWIGKQIKKGNTALGNAWDNTAKNLMAKDTNQFQQGVGNLMNYVGDRTTDAAATVKRLFTSDLNKVNVFGDKVNSKAKLDELLALLDNSDSQMSEINPDIINELRQLPEDLAGDAYEALLQGKDIYGNPLEPSNAMKSIYDLINAERIRKGKLPYNYDGTINHEYKFNRMTDDELIDNFVELRNANLINDEELITNLRKQGFDDAQIADILKEQGIFKEQPIAENQYKEFVNPDTIPDTPEMQNADVSINNEEVLSGKINKPQPTQVEPVDIPNTTVTQNDTEALVGKLNELNNRNKKTNTGNAKYDEWIAKNKNKQSNISSEHAEGSGSHVKSETDINTHETTKTPQNEPASHVNENNTVQKELPKKLIENNHTIEQPLEDMKVTKLEPGDAEGSHTSMRDLSTEKPKSNLDNEIYNKDSDINIDTPLKNRYVSDDAEFNKWYDKYEKADKDTRVQMQKDKMTDFNSQEESIDFYNKFNEQVDSDIKTANRNNTKSLVTEDDIMSFADNYKAADILPSAKRQAKIAEKELTEQSALENSTEIMKMFGYGKGEKGVNSIIAKSVSKLKGKNADKELTRLIKARLNNFKSKTALDKYVEQKTAEFDKLGGNLAPRAKSLLNDAYKELSAKKGWLEETDINNQPIVPHKPLPEYKNSEPKKPYAYNNKTVLGTDTSKTDLSNTDYYGEPIKNKVFKTGENQLKEGETIQEWRLRQEGNNKFVEDKSLDDYSDYDISNTDFYKADRSVGSKHKTGSYAKDFSKGNLDVEKAINEYVNDIDLTFEDMTSAGRNYEDGSISINSNMSPLQQLLTGTHEIHHALSKLIAKACGENSREWKLWQECLDVNNAIRNIENKTPGVIKLYNTFKKLKGNKEGLKKWLKDLSSVAKKHLQEYKDAIIDYKYVDCELEANLAKDGEWIFFGKDIKHYEKILKDYKRKLKETEGSNIRGNSGQQGTNGDFQSGNGKYGNITNNNGQRRYIEDKDIGLKSIKEQADEFDFKRAEHDKQYADNFIKNMKSDINTAEDIVQKRHLATDAQILGRLEKTGAESYLAPTQKRLLEKKAKYTLNDLKNTFNEWWTGESEVSSTDKVKELFGHKKSNLEKKHSLQQQYVNTQLRKAKVQAVDKVMNYVESMPELKPVTNGKILPGYVGIKQGVMSNTLATGRGHDFYKLLDRCDEDEIFKTLVPKEYHYLKGANKTELEKNHPEAVQAFRAAKHFYDIASKEKEYTYQVPKNIYKALTSLDKEGCIKAYKQYGLTGGVVKKALGTMVDVPLNTFKRAVLGLSMGWNIGNRINNPVLLYAHENNFNSLMKHYAQSFGLKNKELPPELFDNNLFEANKFKEVASSLTGDKKVDAFIGLLSGQTVEKGAFNSAAWNALKFTTIHKRILSSIAETNMKFNEIFENMERRVAYTRELDKLPNKYLVKNVGGNILRQQLTLAEKNSIVLKDPRLRKYVLQRVEDTLGDFNLLTPTEKKICKRVAPFYSWIRTITRSIYKVAEDNPVKALMMLKTVNDIREDDYSHKEWQKGSIPISANLTRDDRQTLYNPTRYLNYFDTHEDLAEHPQSSLNPFLNLATETATGKSTFTGKNLISKRYAQESIYDGKDENGTTKYKDVLYDIKKNDYVRDKDGKPSNKLPLDSRIKHLGIGGFRLLNPELNSSMVDFEKAVSMLKNKRSKDTWKSQQGKVIELDKKYDDAFFGYNNGDIYRQYKDKKGNYHFKERYASSTFNKKGQFLKHLIPGIQVEMPLNKAEKLKAWKAKHKKK